MSQEELKAICDNQKEAIGEEQIISGWTASGAEVSLYAHGPKPNAPYQHPGGHGRQNG